VLCPLYKIVCEESQEKNEGTALRAKREKGGREREEGRSEREEKSAERISTFEEARAKGRESRKKRGRVELF
jgi:hypothetical protein